MSPRPARSPADPTAPPANEAAATGAAADATAGDATAGDATGVRGLRRHHLAGLGLVAALAVGSTWAAARVGDAREGGARLINVAGRQRMLSQNLAATALAATSPGPGPDAAPDPSAGTPDGPDAAELGRLAAEFDAGHRAVLGGWAGLTAGPGDRGEAVRLDAAARSFRGAVGRFRADLAAGRAGPAAAAGLRLRSRDFLATMDRFVGLCEERVGRRVAAARRPSAAALAATLAAIAFVYVAVLRPTERQIGRQLAALEGQRRELRTALDRADAAGRAKTQFLANMSHELRTPLQAVLGYADIAAAAADGGRPDAARDAWRVVRRSGLHLLRLINTVLDLTKIEAGRVRLELSAVPTAALVRELLATLRPRAAGAVTLACRLDPAVPPALATDPTRLRQILLNLLGNAVKFTAAGSVTLTVRPAAAGSAGSPAGAAAGPPVWEFVVADTGCGVPRTELDRLFRPFEQADASTTRTHGGTGLGLAVSRRLAERLGGSLTADSVPHVGSTFTLRLPAAPAAAPRDRPADASAAGPPSTAGRGGAGPLAGLRVLLAEDTEDNRRLLSFFLTRDGAAVELAENGRQAVDRLLAGPAGGPPVDVVLMDMQMPVLDGYEATRELRARSYAGPIVALTAHAMAGDADVCLTAGCDAYAAKPITREALAAAVLTAAAHDPAAPRQSSPGRTRTFNLAVNSRSLCH